MSAICAKRTAGVDVERPLPIAAVDVAVGEGFRTPAFGADAS